MICTECNMDLPIEAFQGRPDRPKKLHSSCRQCNNKKRRETRAKSSEPEKYAKRVQQYLAKYDIPKSLAEKLANDRSGICEMCHTEQLLEVDHCHSTDKVRGLICHHCNILLGAARDNIATLIRAIQYLEKH